MHISLTDAKAKLTDLVRRAEAGEEIFLTRHGQPVISLTPVKRKHTQEERDAAVRELQQAFAAAGPWDTDAAHSADFLYDENGMPG